MEEGDGLIMYKEGKKLRVVGIQCSQLILGRWHMIG